MVSGLVQRLGSLDFVNDNAGCFANGGRFPKNGRIIEFGSHRVYFGTVTVRQRLSPVLVANVLTLLLLGAWAALAVVVATTWSTCRAGAPGARAASVVA